MAKFCTYCGAPLEQDAVSCKECGVKVLGAEDNVQPAAPAPVQTPPQPEPAPAPKKAAAPAQTIPTGKYAVASTSSFFWFSLLFSLPVIGFICSIIFSFASKNLNTKHFARSVMIWHIVAVVAAILMFVVAFVLSFWLGITICDFIEEFGYFYF